MSWVTNTILHLGPGDEDKITAINAIFRGSQKFVSMDDESIPRGWYGGYKMLEANLYVAALNNISVDALVDQIRGIKFRERDAVQLIVMDQEDYKFRVIDIFPEEPERE